MLGASRSKRVHSKVPGVASSRIESAVIDDPESTKNISMPTNPPRMMPGEKWSVTTADTATAAGDVGGPCYRCR